MNIQQFTSSLCHSGSKLDFILDGDARFQFVKLSIINSDNKMDNTPIAVSSKAESK